jgi:hypothetical protein
MMNNALNVYNKYMKSVGAKVSAAMKDITASGNRNVKGFQFSAQRIIQSSENLFHMFKRNGQYNDPVKALYRGFSETPGLSNVGNVAGVDVVDINIAATQQSVLGYLSAERGLDKPIDTLWFEGLKALNTVGGYFKGQWVNRPYLPMSRKIRNAVRGAFAEVPVSEITGDVTVKSIIAAAESKAGQDGQVNRETIQIVAGDKVIGKYVDGDMFFTDGSTVDANGVITFATTDAKVIAAIDKTTERDGKNTLKLKPATETLQISAKPRRIHLEQSYEDNAYMNKQAFKLSQTGVDLDYGKIAVNTLLDTYVKFLDFDSVITTAEAIEQFDEAPMLDMTDYIMTTSDPDAKNDIMNQYIIKLNMTLQQKCGKGFTALLVDSNAAAILGNNKEHFTSNPTFDQELDGLIGTYRGTPVIRHHALDGAYDDADNTYGVIYAIYKAPDGSLAPTVYAEYLPPYSAVPALNFDNAAQFSQELLSMSACKAISDDMDVQLGAWMRIKVGANLASGVKSDFSLDNDADKNFKNY